MTLIQPHNNNNVSTHSRPKAAGKRYCREKPPRSVSTHSRPKAAGNIAKSSRAVDDVSTHSRPKAAGLERFALSQEPDVSTHSRPKAAGKKSCLTKPTAKFQHTAARRRLAMALEFKSRQPCFNTQPPEGGWMPRCPTKIVNMVSTHSRPKAAGSISHISYQIQSCFNTQPPEGGWTFNTVNTFFSLSFNTQPPEGGWPCHRCWQTQGGRFQHTAARRRLGHSWLNNTPPRQFQHTAARRRLGPRESG